MNTTLVLYHSNCADGFGAAWAAWKKLGNKADYKDVSYGSELPDVEQYHTIYILDFSYPRDVLEELRTAGFLVKIVDHHKSAQEALKDFPGAIFDMEHSGAYLAWKYFHPELEIPHLIRLVEDRDLWFFKLPHSRELSAWIWSYPFDFTLWSQMAEVLER
jgi:oligoribonuclease NrnB/cAMP/cGMP phosphodiesterase (DHH superfamily)